MLKKGESVIRAGKFSSLPDEVIAGEKAAFGDVTPSPQLSNTAGGSYGNPRAVCNWLFY